MQNIPPNQNFEQSSLKSNFQTPETHFLNSKTSKNISKNIKKASILQQGNADLFELNQQHFKEADENFKNLKIEGKINIWMSNCQRWFFKNVITLVLQENAENIFELNHELTNYFGKYLFEIQNFDNSTSASIRNNRYNRITIDDLLINRDILRKNSISPLSSDFHEINKINEKMNNLLLVREKLEKYIKITGYENYQIRLIFLNVFFFLFYIIKILVLMK